jgi:hypothetical protein
LPKWVHDRAKLLQKKNPEMPESEAWAIATKQFKKKGKGKTASNSSQSATTPVRMTLWEGFRVGLQEELSKTSGLLSPLGAMRQTVNEQKGALSNFKPNWSKAPKPALPQPTAAMSRPAQAVPRPVPAEAT